MNAEKKPPTISTVPLCSFILLIVLTVLLAACSLFGADTHFADLSNPVFQAETNALKTNGTSLFSVPSVALRTIAQEGTDVLATVSTNSMDALDDKHKLAIGDRISFRIVEDEEDPKPLFVTDSGDLEVPYLGRFGAVGLSCQQLARALKTELEKEYYYQATVIVAVDLMTKSRGKVYLVGAVRSPGPQEIPSDEVFTLSKAILRAGGFTDFADKHGVKVTRKGGPGAKDKAYTINVAEILEKGKTGSDLTLEPGDFIYISERSIRF
jgi:protein involved in polysaccharide export with SLBB domain